MTHGVVFLCCLSLGCSSRARSGQSADAFSLTVVDSAAPNQASASVEIANLVISATTEENSLGPIAQTVNLGVVRQGDCVRRNLVVENRSLNPVTIDRFEASCDCLTLVGLPLTVAAHGKSNLEVELNQSHEREFHGELGVDAICYSGERPVFRLIADISVIVAPESQLEYH
jgi:hypothetical protein